jgi:tetratricopeptide (TPR) repeat protein
MNYAWFEKIAPHLAGSPLVLIGFVLLLAFGIHSQLIKSGLLSQVDKKDSGLIIRLFLRYGFWLALTLLLAGVGLEAWKSYMEKEKTQVSNREQFAKEVAAQVAAIILAREPGGQEAGEAAAEAVTALPKVDVPASRIDEALQALQRGDAKQAQAIFAEVLKTKEAQGRAANKEARAANKEAAAAARHLGALAYMNNTKEALAAYQKAVELDPDNANGWNQLGLLLDLTGELAQAEAAYRKVLAVDGTKEAQAAATGNLGLVYRRRGDLAQAEEMQRKSLTLHEALGSKEGMALNYGNLGSVYLTRGELDKAEEMYKKALALHEALGSKEGMAADYGNLGLVYEERGDLAQAEELWKKSLRLYQEMGHPDAKEVQQWLDDLGKQGRSIMK